VSDYRRQQAWVAGNKAGKAGLPSDRNNRQRGTIFYDDWADGWEEGRYSNSRASDAQAQGEEK
tara:strand:- start:28690 stop:28878 length:189 start_codon:yes stop_codon:yes gene_type:complete